MLKNFIYFILYLSLIGMSGKSWAQENTDCSATFSLETGELSLPCVTILNNEQDNHKYKVEMQQVASQEDFHFIVTQAQAISISEIPEEDVPFSIIYESIGGGGIYGDFGEGFAAIRDEASFTSLWQQELFPENTHRIPQPEKPVIDFKQEMVIAVFAGASGNEGIRMKVRKIVEKKDPVRHQVIVSVAVILPSPGSNPAISDGYISPYQLIRVKRLYQPIMVNTFLEYSPSWPPEEERDKKVNTMK